MQNKQEINSFSTPQLVRFEITAQCSLGCSHCYISENTRKINDMDLQHVKDVIDRLASIPHIKILFLGGEPLERKDIIEIVKHAKSRGVYAGIDTNASLLTPELAKALKHAGLDKLNVTIYGTTSKTHDAFTKPGHFRKIINALALAKAEGINTDLAFLLTRKNFLELFRVEGFAKKYSAKDVHLDVFMSLGGIKQQESFQLNVMQFALFWGIIRPVFSKLNLLGHGSLSDSGIKVSLCERRTVPLIKPDGEVWPCLFYPYSIGNILKFEPSDIWARLSCFAYDKNICRKCVESKLANPLKKASASSRGFSSFIMELHGFYNGVMRLFN
ncbi:MAG: hypothetical protein A2X34_05200 [Elusimicrobia bacterium GWC2_51_8]|nr:MAG: hypothetical protein A2X33_05995 [Elusimicrobia bacterium GWA2_51_34]OGR57999.1 MAG: hypothetical protein A2X34_05200 [Elusimicrobia bacterium GWC2_51_8]OGR88198.1 MAG: hypothetical protein A2021_01140 [Elusimicrobia bacterium GWF2_52_66]HAF95402.1 hypothetical protein [Elusimicrobiota bacterium]HCE98734.1 hypothetical protein [Elusimicrobiota bacterium]